MTTMTKLDDRYGRTSSRRRTLVWIVVAAVAVALVGGLAWTTVTNALSSVDADTTGFEVVDDRTVSITFQVVAPAGANVACALEAQDEEHGVVGWRVVELDLGGARTFATTEQIPTVAGATTGLVNSCWVA